MYYTDDSILPENMTPLIHLNALSAMIDYRPATRLDVYAGVMWSRVHGGPRERFPLPRKFRPHYRSAHPVLESEANKS